MPDMLVKLYGIPAAAPEVERLAGQGLVVRPARAPEKPAVLSWMQAHFPFWVPEVEAAYGRLPVSCFIAMREQELLGFACYDAICPNFFGPTGVLERERRKGIGKALLVNLAKRAVAENCSRVEWSVLDWNEPSIEFYKSLGAKAMDKWTIFRLTDAALEALARGAT